MSPEYSITGPTLRRPNIHIDTCDDYTPAQAMEFALSIIEAAKRHVTFTDRQAGTLSREDQ